jgi:hypothetical protein
MDGWSVHAHAHHQLHRRVILWAASHGLVSQSCYHSVCRSVSAAVIGLEVGIGSLGRTDVF